MKIEITKLPIFCLTCENESDNDSECIKRKSIKTEFELMNNGSGPEFINPIMIHNGEKIPKNKSGSSGFIRMIESGLMKQIPGKPFIPFIIIEDDVSFFSDASKSRNICIPEDTDILYIGLSCCSMNATSFHYKNYYESVENPELVRIKHMLASHGLIICSPLGAAALQRTMMETWFSETPWDVPMAYIQPYYHIYALREPLVYQNETRGGDSSCTRIILHDNGNNNNNNDNLLPNEYITCELATIFLPDKRLV
jgi:hypothetical protein